MRKALGRRTMGGQGDALPIAAGEAADPALQEMIDLSSLAFPQPLSDLGPGYSGIAAESRYSGARSCAGRAQTAGTQMQYPRRRRQRGHVFTIEQDAAKVGSSRPHHTQRRCLAAA